MEFVIHRWGAYSAAHPTDDKNALADIPRLLKRRLTPLARGVFTAIHRCQPDSDPMPLVFSSVHGELAKSFAMMQQIEAGEEISPTHFSLSVHNAIAGLFAMAFNNQHECSVIAPGQDGLVAGFLEATGLLAEGHEQVLLVFYDEPLVEFYPSAPFRLSADELAIALWLKQQGEGIKTMLTCHPITGEPGAEQPVQLPALLRFLQQPDTPLVLHTPHATWRWQHYAKPA